MWDSADGSDHRWSESGLRLIPAVAFVDEDKASRTRLEGDAEFGEDVEDVSMRCCAECGYIGGNAEDDVGGTTEGRCRGSNPGNVGGNSCCCSWCPCSCFEIDSNVA